jgi:DNA invertase Pin-like site-specific DNA recombinase
MSTELQQYSLQFQAAVVRSYAEAHGFTVVKTYTDAGKSGLVLKHREGLAQLLHDVVAGGQVYRAVLVYDVSRWGRFQDTDESAHYEFLCKQAGKTVHYCAESFSNEATMANTVMKSLKRIMAAEYSRELSEKMFHCMTRMVAQGRWVGGRPGYGLRRMLVSAEGSQGRIMSFGEHKELRNGHVLIVPGPAEEIACVREIFRMYTQERKSTTLIAKKLNEKGIPREGVPWSYRAVTKILFDEKYAGSLVWNRWTQRLSGHWTPVPRDRWIVQPGAIEPIINKKTFEKARQIRAELALNASDEDLLDMVRGVLASHGRLTSQIINQSNDIPSTSCYIARFGSLPRLYELLHYVRKDTFRLRQQTGKKVAKLHFGIFKQLRTLYRRDIVAVRALETTRPKKLRFSSGLEVSIAVCLSERTLAGSNRWRFQSTAARRSGLITLLARCNMANTGFRDFIVMPSVTHIRVVSLLKEDDERLRVGTKLRTLRNFRALAHSVARG